MDAKICLCSRGASLEAFRYFEALWYGCLVVQKTFLSLMLDDLDGQNSG